MRWVRGVVGHVMLYFVPDGLDCEASYLLS